MATGILYIVGTPLGHLGDLSERVIATLRTVPIVAAEDTRHSRRLLGAIGASPRKLLSYHAHSDRGREETFLELLRGGEDVALITDAGTPAVSDPGVDLVAAALAEGIRVVPIPGPSAVATLLSAAGLPADRYLFLGFPPRKGRERREMLGSAAASPYTVVWFEAANRLTGLLEDLIEHAGPDRVAVIGRELTKLHEEVRRGPLQALLVHYRLHSPMGEVSMALAAQPTQGREAPDATTVAMIQDAVREWLAAGESRREAVRRVTAEFGLPRNDAYRLVMDT
jgi:16S rRNA (cytidine1402-2'-O)-methyltransferase